MSLVFHLRRVKSLPNSISGLGIWLTLFIYFQLCKGQPSCAQERARIINGASASEGRFPYMCSLRKMPNGSHICGGVLINKDWIMTAAHCVDPNNENSTGLSPFAYCNTIYSNDSHRSKRFETRCHLHRMWSGDFGNGGDIALCELDRSTQLNIPQLASIDQSFTEASVLYVMGWGKTNSTSEASDTLQIGKNLTYVSNSACSAKKYYVSSIIESMICSGGKRVDTCAGDSGGPLFIPCASTSSSQSEDRFVDQIVGITSFGSEICGAGVPGVYTRVSCYRPWIECVIQRNEKDCRDHIPCEKQPCLGIPKSSNFNEANAFNRFNRAIRSDESERVNQILCEGLSPNTMVDNDKNSLLQIAAQYNAVESAKVLLDQKADIEYKNEFGRAALSAAARYNSTDVLKLLIDSGADIESRNFDGQTALSLAAIYNRRRVVQDLIKRGANIESKDGNGFTPLHHAASWGHSSVVITLLDLGASKKKKNDDGKRPHEIICTDRRLREPCSEESVIKLRLLLKPQ